MVDDEFMMTIVNWLWWIYDDGGDLMDEPINVSHWHCTAILILSSLPALDFLDEHFKVIVDKLAVAETKIEIFLQLERRSEAVSILWDLLDRNPENKKYYTLLEEALQAGVASS